MASEIRSNIETRVDQLKAKLRAREGNKAFAENCVAIKAEIARWEKALESHQ